MNEKYKYFIKNIATLSLGKISTKVIVFLMIPIYTSALSPEEYGIFDFVNTIICMCLPIFTINIQTSILKFIISNTNKKDDIILIATRVFFVGTFFFSIALILNYYIVILAVLKEYIVEVLLLYIVTGYFEILSEYARATDKMNELVISSILATFSTVLVNIFALIFFKMGLDGFFCASIIGPLVGVIYLFTRCDVLEHLKKGMMSNSLYHKMIKYSLPMVLNSLSWWVNGMSDRYLVIAFCGLTENGLYALSYKLVAIFDFIQNIFNQAWCVSALKEYDKNDKNGFFYRMYSLYLFFLVFLCAFFFLLLDFLSSILFSKEFIDSWIYVPFLTLASFFGGLSGFIGVIFSAVNKTGAFAFTTLLGGGVNIVLNLILIPIKGAVGAAIASLCSYTVVFLARAYIVKDHLDINWINRRAVISTVVLLLQVCLLLTSKHNLLMYAGILISDCVLIYVFKEEVSFACKNIRFKVFKRG